jgi:hypothetical protein
MTLRRSQMMPEQGAHHPPQSFSGDAATITWNNSN